MIAATEMFLGKKKIKKIRAKDLVSNMFHSLCMNIIFNR